MNIEQLKKDHEVGLGLAEIEIDILFNRITELEKTVASCKLTFETMRAETGMNLESLVCWKLINQVTRK